LKQTQHSVGPNILDRLKPQWPEHSWNELLHSETSADELIQMTVEAYENDCVTDRVSR